MIKPDDSSLTAEQYTTVRNSVIDLLNKSDAWGRLPTPIDDVMAAAKLKLAPISAFDEGVIERYARKFGLAAKTLVKSAIDKVLGILDVHGNIVHIDGSVNKEKQNFLKLHETGHNELPHQRGLFRWVQDCKKMLEPDISELFEREANIFASIALFQDGHFAKVTADSPFGIKVPLAVGRKFGASAYASFREYVRRNEKACAIIVLNAPTPCNIHGFKSDVRRIDPSPEFVRRFGGLVLPETITPDSVMAKFIPATGKRMSRPNTLALEDRNKVVHEFVAEGFCTPFNVFILMHAKLTLNKTTIIMPAGFKASA
ncbi:ImmA/IrrE family metallo-endopeptidase [Bradyrhizobium roseum]|uniref:ImmA/IrrE family metallo-endopeptidase n=1 Tax=Bradyrhizobium roseum TaxID=3056648 RepID=UPI0026099243|nr:ImmA/IrrE family metallo-endopeptidase [Bradyrhizobium roseus]WKA26220.1 ImmA/IrrE family metallo-endopeptidase [Bradyrhizobium roseus]